MNTIGNMDIYDFNVLQKEPFTIVAGETNPVVNFPELVGQNKRIILNTSDDTFYAQIKYSYSTDWIVIELLDTNQYLIQSNTYVADFPNNLINCEELIGYGLFYLNSTFYFVELPKKWYYLKLNEAYAEEVLKNALLQA